MLSGKRKKSDSEYRLFQEKWTNLYLFTEVNKKPVCLVCKQQVSIMKDYNLKRHYETQHAQKFGNIKGDERTTKIQEMIANLKKQQCSFTNLQNISDSAMKASYVIANEIALASKPFSDGEFIKMCMLKAAEIVCPAKRQAFANISLTRNTVADRISELSEDISIQLKNKIKSFITFSIALDESTDITDVAQLAIFIRGIDKSLTITEEFLELIPIFS